MRSARARQLTRLALGALLLAAGAAHLVSPRPFVQHVPPALPAAELIVAVSGVAELLLGLALIAWKRQRQLAGWLTAGFLVLVLPGNVYVAVFGVAVDGLPGGAWPWLRLLLQPVLIAGALWSTNCPEHRAAGEAPTH